MHIWVPFFGPRGQ